MPPSVKTPVGEAPVIPLFLIGTGMYLSWFGVHYWKSDVKYPTDPIKAILQGKGLPAATQTPSSEQAAVLAVVQATGGVNPSAATAGASSAAVPGVSSPGALSATAQQNIAVGKLLAAGYGWGPNTADWAYLQSGWQEESGWNQLAANVPSDPYNHAYGIPQANPGTKMASAGPLWKTDPTTQIKWGLAYIKSTYGSPSRVPGWTPTGVAAGYVGY
jgi:hypothetical protein